MKVLVTVKRVIDPYVKVRVKSDGTGVETDVEVRHGPPGSPGMALLMDEAVLPAAFNPWAGGVLPMDDGGLRAELQGLRSELNSRLDQLAQAVERQTVVDAAVARESLAQGAQIVDNTAASRTAALLEANKPTPVRSGAA